MGGSEVHPKGKPTPEFFINLLKIAGAEPDEVVHVGDNPQVDPALAEHAGIKQVFLPRRDQVEEWVREPDGGIYVKSLAFLSKLLQHP